MQKKTNIYNLNPNEAWSKIDKFIDLPYLEDKLSEKWEDLYNFHLQKKK